MNLPKIHSITKKILVALVGSFLLVFLLFHMTANLFILRHDEGAWYSAFCHFMGTNWVVKIFEIVLLGVIALHILLTLWLAVTNRLARPVRYHERAKSKTHPGSKLMMWTGILIFVCLIIHFCDFYFVKLGWVKGEYMVKTEKLQSQEIMGLVQYSQQMGLTPEEMIDELETQSAMYTDENGVKWVLSGDLGYRDDDGFFFFSGRKKRVIIIAGYNVYPSDLEKKLSELPQIKDVCAVQGWQNGRSIVRLFVSTRESVNEDAFREKICQIALQTFSKFYVPREIVFLKELPQTPLMKVDFMQLTQHRPEDPVYPNK